MLNDVKCNKLRICDMRLESGSDMRPFIVSDSVTLHKVSGDIHGFLDNFDVVMTAEMCSGERELCWSEAEPAEVEWEELVRLEVFLNTLPQNLQVSFLVTRLWPSASRPPRSTSDRLVNHRLIFLAYGIVGITQAMAGLFVYLVIMASYGW